MILESQDIMLMFGFISLMIVAYVLPSTVEGQSIRLVSSSGSTSSSNTAGRLEVYYSGQWGTVCDDGFGASDARTACRQLGFTTYSRYGSVSSLGYRPASSSTPIWLDDLSCPSTATNLNQCRSNGYGYHNCVHSEDVAISCTTPYSSGNSLQKGSNTVAVVCGIIALLLTLINCELQ